MITDQDKKTFADVSVIIKMMPKSMQNKINLDFLKFIEDNKDTEYVSSINKNIPINKQTLNSDTKTLLALIYRDYLCSEAERKQLLINEQQELLKYENELKKKYEVNFNKASLDNKNTNLTSLVQPKKENLLKRIFNKILRFFIS